MNEPAIASLKERSESPVLRPADDQKADSEETLSEEVPTQEETTSFDAAVNQDSPAADAHPMPEVEDKDKEPEDEDKSSELDGDKGVPAAGISVDAGDKESSDDDAADALDDDAATIVTPSSSAQDEGKKPMN